MRFNAVEISDDRAEAFFDEAPFVSRRTTTYDASAEDLWSVISSDRMWSWLPTVWGCRYPVNVEVGRGTVRDFQMRVWHYLIFAQHERILAWEPGRRIAYTATDATLPVFGSWCEEYSLEPLGPTQTRLHWTLAVRPRYIGRLPLKWVALLLALPFRIGLRGLVGELPHQAPSADLSTPSTQELER